MAKVSKELLPHLLIKNSASTEAYARPPKAIAAQETRTPPRDRQFHAEQLLNQIEQIKTLQTEIIQAQKAFSVDVSNGIYLAFETDIYTPVKNFSSGGCLKYFQSAHYSFLIVS